MSKFVVTSALDIVNVTDNHTMHGVIVFVAWKLSGYIINIWYIVGSWESLATIAVRSPTSIKCFKTRSVSSLNECKHWVAVDDGCDIPFRVKWYAARVHPTVLCIEVSSGLRNREKLHVVVQNYAVVVDEPKLLQKYLTVKMSSEELLEI